MILYLGTSALVALYVVEPFSEIIKDLVRAAEIVATSRIAYTEVMSALDIRFKKGDMSRDDYDFAVTGFSKDWQHLAKVDFDDYEAGNFVKKYGLTRFGALHLSAAKLILRECEKQKLDFETLYKSRFDFTLLFLTADKNLSKAAAAEGVKTLPLY
jgi:uncharacterized protein